MDFGFWILDFGFWISDFGFWILDFGFRILDFGFWISDFGFWILERYAAFLFVQILDFGFWILDFGFWILDFGFWISDFGFWILDFGFWILDFEQFWMLHNIQYCARRPGSADFHSIYALFCGTCTCTRVLKFLDLNADSGQWIISDAQKLFHLMTYNFSTA